MENTLVLEKLSESLDITPSQYQEAVSRYNHLSAYIKSQNIECETYLQGSFRLGTVIRPYSGMEDRDYDLDIVCEISNINRDAKLIKNAIGDILKKSVYNKYLDDEGRRCWTLNYKEKDSEGFHIDLLPCIPEEISIKNEYRRSYSQIDYSNAISLTHKEENKYSFRSSNPKGFANWFYKINDNITGWSRPVERAKVFAENRNFFINNLKTPEAKDVNNIFVRTPLQRVIQILKRHRDYMFSGKDNEGYKPISIIITVLVCKISERNNGKYNNVNQLMKIVLDSLDKYSVLNASGVDSDFLHFGKDERLIEKLPKGNGWKIENPADPKENLADRWKEDNDARAKCFFSWIKNVKQFIQDIMDSSTEENSRQILNKCFGPSITKKTFDSIKKYEENNKKTEFKEIKSTAKPYSVNE